MSSIEETTELHLDFSKLTRLGGQEVIPVALQDARTKEVLLIAYTNEEALRETLRLRRVVLWSTSRNRLWDKGSEESGNRFAVEEIRVNCEQNSLVYFVTPEQGGICHTKTPGGENRNCYYRKLDFATGGLVLLPGGN